MNQHVTRAIILSRTDYGEADRILTLLTPDYGKLSLLAKGVRRIKSKLAGGIELFSVSEITFIQGRGSVGTLVSTRLLRYYEHIVKDLERTMFGYELIKRLHKITEDEPEEVYFDLLQETFQALDDPSLPLELIHFWFAMQLLRYDGHTPNLHTDSRGVTLAAGQLYDFDFEHMAFTPHPHDGLFSSRHIQFLRLCVNGNPPRALARIVGCMELVAALSPLVSSIQASV